MRSRIRNGQETFCRRLKEARLQSGLSQKGLGVAAGIDEFVASTRINRYEQGVHEADATTMANLAKALHVPVAYFYAENDRLAQMILIFSKISTKDQEEMLRWSIAKNEAKSQN